MLLFGEPCSPEVHQMNQLPLDTGQPRIAHNRRSLLGRWRFGWIAVLVLIAIGIAFYNLDLFNDRAISNLICLIAIAAATLVSLSTLYRWLALKSSRRVSGLLIFAIVLLPLAVFKFRGFSGEMTPLLEFRFASAAKLQESIAQPIEQPELSESATTAFSQFLGANRNAIIDSREFAVPDGDEEEMWRIAIGAGWAGFAIQQQYCVTLEQREKLECVTCYRLSDGALLWIQSENTRHQTPLGGTGPRSTPTIVGDLVYTQGATGIVQCLKLATGELVWKQNVLTLAGWQQTESEASVTWGRAGSPLVIDRLCVIPFGRPLDAEPNSDLLAGRSLIALDAETGEVKWTAGEDQISFASPVLMTLDDRQQIVSVNEATVTGHRIADGHVLWSIAWPGRSNGGANCSSAVPVNMGGTVGNDSFLIAKGYATGCGVFTVFRRDDNWSVEERWKDNRVLKTKFTHTCVDGDVGYGLSDGTLECVRLSDGKRLWAQGRSTRYGHGQMIRVGDCLVVQAEGGKVAFVAATSDQFKELSSIDALREKSWNVPSIAGRYLVVRNDVEAVMYRLPAR